jgi:hypothetical protein
MCMSSGWCLRLVTVEGLTNLALGSIAFVSHWTIGKLHTHLLLLTITNQKQME